jgi:hypothetical protein
MNRRADGDRVLMSALGEWRSWGNSEKCEFILADGKHMYVKIDKRESMFAIVEAK